MFTKPLTENETINSWINITYVDTVLSKVIYESNNYGAIGRDNYKIYRPYPNPQAKRS